MSDRNALISPAYCWDSRDIFTLIAEFGPYSGRYVYQYPQEWKSKLEQHITELNLSPVEEAQAKRLISRELDTALLGVKAKFDDAMPWEKNVGTVERFAHVPLVVGSAVEPMGYKAWVEALPEIYDSRRRSWFIGGALNDYLTTIEPLLQKSPAGYMVDRHFDPLDNGSYHFLVKLLEKIRTTSCYELHLITRYKAINEDRTAPLSSQQIQSELLDRYSEKVPSGRKLIFHFVEEDREGGSMLRMHNRYFLTKHGAIDFGIGFKLITQQHKQISVHVVDKPAHEILKATYIDGVTRFDARLPKNKTALHPIHVDSIVVQG